MALLQGSCNTGGKPLSTASRLQHPRCLQSKALAAAELEAGSGGSWLAAGSAGLPSAPGKVPHCGHYRDRYRYPACPGPRSGPAPPLPRSAAAACPAGSDALRQAEVTCVACGPGPAGGFGQDGWIHRSVRGARGPVRESGALGWCSGGASAKAE